MKIIGIVIGAVCVSAVAAAFGLFMAVEASGTPLPKAGTWSLNSWGTGNDVALKLSFSTPGSRFVWGTSVPVAKLRGLDPKELGSAHAPVSFTLERDAGSYVFTGTVVMGVGRGDVRFVPSTTYAAKLADLGYGTVSDKELFELAIRDLSLQDAGDAKQVGPKDLTLTGLLRLLDHGVDLPFLIGMKSAGCPDSTVDSLIALREHGVDPAYVAQVQSSGYENLSIEDMIKLREHGID